MPVPPLAEQHRIVAKLDALFARSHAAKASLENIPLLLERLRQSVLAAAFRGDLTAEWRLQQTERDAGSRDLQAVSDAQSNNLPPGWHWTSLDQVTEIAGGLTKNGTKRGLAPRKVPLVSVAAVHLREIRPDAIGSIGLLQEDGARGELRQDDLLLVEGNGSLAHIGRVALWDGSVPEARHQNHLIRLRPFQVSPRYLLEWLASPRGRDSIIREATSAAGLYTLSLSKVARLPVPVAPPDEQHEIVARVSAALNQIRSIELLAEQATERCTMLESAALAKAFRGELIPQDSNDEPASVLLERIRAEREAPRPAKSKRSASTSAPARSRTGKAAL
jgi:type I restriction enzyme S subunit